MERPTCKTCPHWDAEHDEDEEPTEGICRRFPPVLICPQPAEKADKSWCADAWEQPFTAYCMSCSEHPDFPAYIASLKPTQ